MSQHFLSCLECAVTLELEEGEQVKLRYLVIPEHCAETLSGFLLLHRGHLLMFTTKE